MDMDLGQFRRINKSILSSRGSPNTTKEEKTIGCCKNWKKDIKLQYKYKLWQQLERNILNYNINTSYENNHKIIHWTSNKPTKKEG
jgi:hypothetical protein